MQQIVRIDPRTDPLWQELVDKEESSVFHSPEWIRVLTETYDFDIYAYVAVEYEQSPTAGILICQISDIIGQRRICLPFSDHCDLLSSNETQWNKLINLLIEDDDSPILIKCLHNNIPVDDDRFTTIKRAKWHGLDIHADLDTLWQQMHRSTKGSINKAHKKGVVVRTAEQKEELRAFFDMWFGLRKYKYRLLAQPYTFFENIWQHIVEKQKGLLLIAEYENTIIGATLFLKWKDTLYYKFNASLPSHLDLRSNDTLLWEGIQYGASHGFAKLDFGLSDWDQEGLLQYKRKFASEEKTISFARYALDSSMREHENQVRQFLPRLTDLLTDASVPDATTEKAGELLYRFFV